MIAHGRDRTRPAPFRLAAYLDRVRIGGIATNVPLVKRILRDPVFRAGDYDTGYLPRFLERTDAASMIEEIETAAGDDVRGIGRDAIAIEDSDELRVLSPSTGIFYSAPSPAEPDYVEVGQRFGSDDILCQLEAFKIFSPLRLGDFNTPDTECTRRGYLLARVNVSTDSRSTPRSPVRWCARSTNATA